MKSSSEHGDLILFAVVASLVLHGVLMFFAAPHVMSHTAGSSDFEARRTHRPPMSVRRFEGDPFRERVKSVPASDVPAPRSAPTVAQASASSAPTAVPSSGDVPIPAPPVVVPQVLSGPMDAPAELPRPSILNANAIEDTGFTMPSAAEIDAAAPSLPVAPLSAASGGAESVIPVPGMSAPAPVFTLPEIKVGDGAMAGIEAAKKAPSVEFKFENKVLEEVDESFVEEEKAAVRQLLSEQKTLPAESVVSCEMVTYVDPPDPKWRYFKITFEPKRGAYALPIVPKDAVILMDASGSIGKDRIRDCREVAKSVLRSCLNTGDRFNLVAFRNSFSYAFKEWRECDAASFAAADRWLSNLTAHGRTDVFSVIRSVLTLPRDPSRPIIALVVTDGDANAGVSDTAEILSRFTKLNDGLVSVYMYGVKKKANRELIEILTKGNRGESFIHTGFRFNAGKELESLAKAFRDPVLTDLRVAFASSTEAETYPLLLKNLYRGGRVELRGRCPASVKKLVFTLQGLSGKKAFESLYQLNLATSPTTDRSLRDEWLADRAVSFRF
ncbi:MAG: VWA domain-containing protein [Verrucomicrobiota bacterium]|nr:VWA domain-containing protein [Verrucomicrobiota bacterium]